MGGAFLTSRDVFSNPIWNDVPKFRIFFYIYGNAVFSEDGTRVAGIKLERGQFLRSYRNLRDDLEYLENRSVKKYSLSLIKRKVDQLVKEDRLKIEETELGTLFTVVNYASYQGFDKYKNNNENAERTEREQNKNDNGTQREQKRNNNKNVINDIKVNDDNKNDENPHTFYEQNFGMLKPFVSQNITEWSSEMSDELVVASMKLAVKNNKSHFGYCGAILRDWQSKGVQSLEDARAVQKSIQPTNQSNVTPIRKPEKKYNYGF
ncbi:DnaD domain-containing protein [Halobacillus sp. SY10]|uniref:DnaD domain-containing protein n=1 Tax=Halobacillus sp. SY10 TaxID=3381356 RepID=UPI003879875F